MLQERAAEAKCYESLLKMLSRKHDAVAGFSCELIHPVKKLHRQRMDDLPDRQHIIENCIVLYDRFLDGNKYRRVAMRRPFSAFADPRSTSTRKSDCATYAATGISYDRLALITKDAL